MPDDNDPPRRSIDGYSTLQRVCHWSILAIAVWQLATGLATAQLAPALSRELPIVVKAHTAGGTLILVLGFVLLISHHVRGVPAPVPMPGWQSAAATMVHRLLFLALIIVPLSGMATLARAAAAPVHRAAVIASIGLVVVHAAAALFHHFVQRDATLTRILGVRPAPSSDSDTWRRG